MNTYTITSLPVLVPVLLWAWYHYHKDHRLPEPFSHLAIAFTLGVGSFWLGKWLYLGLDLFNLRFDAFLLAETDRIKLLAYCLLVIGPVEELAKMIPFLVVVVRWKEFDEPIDGIIYATFIALGFSIVENLLYVQALPFAQAVARSVAGPAVHFVFASIWGYYIGRAWLCKRHFALTVLGVWVLAGLIHGIYNYLSFTWPPPLFPFAALFILVLWIWRLYLIKDLHGLPDGPCPYEPD